MENICNGYVRYLDVSENCSGDIWQVLVEQGTAAVHL